MLQRQLNELSEGAIVAHPIPTYDFMDFQKDLDARGVNCPLPILRTKKALADMTGGQVLRVVATDPGSVKDFQAFSKQTGNELLAFTQSNKEFTFYLRKR